MIVEIDDKSGFCFGVVKAIKTAEESLSAGKVYSLGDIVHNRVEVQRLSELGLTAVNHEEFANLKNTTVLIRAHGEPPQTYTAAAENSIRIIDATCPVVARLQNIVKDAHRQMAENGGQVALLGKRGHAEVMGLAGQVDGNVVIVENERDLADIDFDRPIYLLSQTTQSLELFNKIADEIKKRASDPDNVTVHDTICRQVSSRGPHLQEFAKKYDVVIFVSGRKSSNGKVLFDVCADSNPQSYLVEDESELDPQWFKEAESVGICGATSTPKWLMAQVAKRIKELKR